MLKRTLHKSFHSSRLPYKHARALLQSNLVSLLLLTLMFLYSNWCYQSLKSRVHTERAAASQQKGHNWHATGPADPSGFLFSWGLNAHQRLGRLGNDTAVPQITLEELEVVGVAASRHTLLVTRSGSVWSMGANDSSGGGGHGSKALLASGQLGRSGGWGPGQVLGPLQYFKVTQVAAGRYHSVALAEGKVYTWGLNDQGQLGRPAGAVLGEGSNGLAAAALSQGQDHKDDRLPHLKRTLHGASGDSTTAAAAAVGQAGQPRSSDASGTVLPHAAETDTQPRKQTLSVAGSGPGSSSGECFSGWSCHDGDPALVEALEGTTVVAVKAGRYSTVVLDASRQLWVWGYDGCASQGQLPLQDEAWRPRRVQGELSGKWVVAFDVGYTFWLAATEDGALYTCDSQDDGYAGTLPEKRKPNNAGQLGRSGTPHQPGLVRDTSKGKKVVSVAAGREHAVVATSDGRVWTFGGGNSVLGRTGSNAKPGLVGGALEGQFIRHVAAGEYFSLAASDSQVFGWGSNAYLCTGTSTNSGTEVLQPTAVAGPLGSGNWSIHALAAGYQHALAVADSGPVAAAKLRSAVPQDTAATGAGVAAGAAEVVLTEQQQQARKRFQEAQQQQSAEQASGPSAPQLPAHADAALAVVPSKQSGTDLQEKPPRVHVSTSPQHTASQAATDAQQPAAGAATAASPDAAKEHAASTAGSSTLLGAAAQTQVSAQAPIISTSPSNSTNVSDADYHWRYLAQKPAPDSGSLKAHSAWAAWKPSPWHDALAALSPDVFALLPKQYNTMHKNPCWGGTGPQLACLPYFNIIGVSKCGTTDLYHRLTLYKAAVLPARNKRVERVQSCSWDMSADGSRMLSDLVEVDANDFLEGPHFWDECPYPPQGPCQAGPSGDFQAYVNLFSMAADAIRSRPSAITGEASSNTFTSANSIHLRGFKGDKPREQWAGAAGVNATMPALLREAQPYLRLILMLRNPVTRYYSAYYYYRWWLKEDKPPSPDDFHAHALKELQEWKGCVAARSVPECVRAYRPQQLVKGMYSEFLPDWLRHWPRQQLLILRYEDYIAAVPQHLKAVLTFLDLPEPEAATFGAMAAAEPQNKKAYPLIRADTRQQLEVFYAPFNAALTKMLGDARWQWADVEGQGQGLSASPHAAATPG